MASVTENMAGQWRETLSFSDRLGVTSKMQSLTTLSSKAYKIANPDCSSGEASKQAKAAEESARKHAASIHEYHELCAKEIGLWLTFKPTEPIEDNHQDEHIFPNIPHTGARIGRYTNAEHYSDGLFSEVFKARGSTSDTGEAAGEDRSSVVALKITTPSLMTAPHDSKREARILASAKSAHIISLYETFQQAGGRLVLVFPFMPFGLDGLLRQGLLLDECSRRGILKDLFSGLAHIHGLGIIHRDIKPANILLASPTGPAYIADFGIAWSPTDEASEPRDEKILDVGTTCYRPPELLFGHHSYGPTLDMWAAGCVAAQVVCLGGQTLFDAGDLGSELALIKSTFEILGTPNLDIWPEAATFPDWGKMNFVKYEGRSWNEILPNTKPEPMDLVKRLVCFESGYRLSALEALDHPYL